VTAMEIKHGLQRTGALDAETARLKAKQAGFTPFVLPTMGIVDRASLFDAVRATLPLDPPLTGSHGWDALSDSLGEGLYASADRRIAIIWQGTHTMATSATSDFETALEVLADVASLLADPRATNGSTKELAILVE
jgi:hypothetical protein